MPLDTLFADEAGNAARYTHAGSSQASPLLVIAGITLGRSQLCAATERLLLARRAAFGAPRNRSLVENLHDNEVKGALLREGLLGGGSGHQQARCWTYTEECMSILEDLQSRVFAHVWLKTPGGWLDEARAYGVSLEHFAAAFVHRLERSDRFGLMVLDGRSPRKDSLAQRAILDLKYSCESDIVTDRLVRLADVPLVSDSKHSAGLQLADVVASALLYPMACAAYSTELGISINRRMHRTSAGPTASAWSRCNTSGVAPTDGGVAGSSSPRTASASTLVE